MTSRPSGSRVTTSVMEFWVINVFQNNHLKMKIPRILLAGIATCLKQKPQKISHWYHRYLQSHPPVLNKSKKVFKQMFHHSHRNYQQSHNKLYNNNRTSLCHQPSIVTLNNTSLLDYHLTNIYDQFGHLVGSQELDPELPFEMHNRLNYHHLLMQYHFHNHQLSPISPIQLNSW